MWEMKHKEISYFLAFTTFFLLNVAMRCFLSASAN
jgi:hypothetical protein